MQITIRTLTGRSVSFEVQPTDTVGSVKTRLCDQDGIPPDQQGAYLLVLSGANPARLDDERQLQQCGVHENATLCLARRVRNG